jgi:hypothetical protein
MSDFGLAVKRLVEIAIRGSKKEQRELGPTAQAVINAFDPEDTKGVKPAMRVLTDGVVAAPEGHPKKLLLLVVGALVEGGAPPELAYPAVSKDLVDILDKASRYAQECLDTCDELHIYDAVRSEGERIAKQMPEEAEAWESVASRCLTAVACLSRSGKLRKKEQATGEIARAAYALEDTVEEVTFLSHIVKLIDDVPLLVIHPESRRGWRLVMNDCTNNVEMYVLVNDAIVGDPAKGFLKGPRPSARALKVLKDPDAAPPKEPPEVVIPWHTVAWTGLGANGEVVAQEPRVPQEWVWLEGVPAEIPIFEGERVIVYVPPLMKRTMPVEPAYAALSPRVQLKSKLAGPEVDRLLAKMGTLSARLAPKRRAEQAALEAKRAQESLEHYEAMRKKFQAAEAAKKRAAAKAEAAKPAAKKAKKKAAAKR